MFDREDEFKLSMKTIQSLFTYHNNNKNKHISDFGSPDEDSRRQWKSVDRYIYS